MKSFVFIVFLTIACACADSQTNRDAITVSFKIQHPTYSKVAVVQSPELIEELELDENGEAACILQGDWIYAQLFYGENVKNVFFRKGDRLTVSFDAGKFKDEIQFEGRNAPINEYLNAITYTEILSEEYARPLEEFLVLVRQKTEEAVQLLQARRLETVNADFVEMEKERIKYMYASHLLMYPMAHEYLTQDTSYRLGKEYYGTLTRLIQGNEQLVCLPAYRTFVSEAAVILASSGKRMPDPYDRCVRQMKYLAENIRNDKVKQILLNEIAVNYVKKKGVRNITDMENIYHVYVTDPALRMAYREVRARWDRTAVGHLSPDFKAQDTCGNVFSLKDFYGKYLYIDLWATWCGPCRKEIPFLKELEKKFKGKNITFLSLSTDQDKAGWEEMVKSAQLSGVQLLIGRDSQFQQDYHINGIPHCILLDPAGKIVDSNMARPSSPDIEKILNALPGI